MRFQLRYWSDCWVLYDARDHEVMVLKPLPNMFQRALHLAQDLCAMPWLKRPEMWRRE